MHAGFDGGPASMVPSNLSVTNSSQREKRRFYVKKSIIGIQEFREWEEKLGDYWYRHHHKVNNIVYYHCKYEPCYASMKAKVLIDCVQLYVTEEGHTHPAPSDMMAPQAKNQLMDGSSISLGSKRKLTADEQYYGGFPSAYPQQFLSEILRMQGDFSSVHEGTLGTNGYSTLSAYSGHDGPPKDGVEVKLENQQALTTPEMRMEAISSVAAVVDATNKYATACMHDKYGVAKKINTPNLSKSGTAHSTTSPVSSPEVRNHQHVPSTSANEKNDALSDESDSDDDSDDSGSEDAKCSSSNIERIANKTGENGEANSGSESNLFRILKAKIENKPARKRLHFLRRMRQRLSYFLQMEELKALSAKLSPATKYEDIFG